MAVNIPGYTFQRYLGKGAFGAALLVQRNLDGGFFAAKQIAFAQPSDEEDARKEANILKDLDCNFIVRYTDFSITPNICCYIVMEFCDGGDLQGKIDLHKKTKKPIDESLVVIWMAQVGLALRYCHNRNLLHRDLKPQNIFLMKDGISCKLGDFGVAKSVASTRALTQTIVGTPLNFCPELCKSQPYTRSADIWAFGCALYEARFLDHPMVPLDGTPLNMITLQINILSGQYPRKSCDIGKIVDRCLQQDPSRRADITDILNHPKFAPVTRDLENGIQPVNIRRADSTPVNPKQEAILSELSKFLQNKKYHKSESDRIDQMIEQVKYRTRELEAERDLCQRVFTEAQREMDVFRQALLELQNQTSNKMPMGFDQKYPPISPYLASLSHADQRTFLDFSQRRNKIRQVLELKQRTEQELAFYNNRGKMLKESDDKIKMLIEELGRESNDREMVNKLMEQLHSDQMEEIMETVRNLPVQTVRNPSYSSGTFQRTYQPPAPQQVTNTVQRFPYQYFALPIHAQGAGSKIIGTRYVVFKNSEIHAQLDVINGGNTRRGRKGDQDVEKFLTKQSIQSIQSQATGKHDGIREISQVDFDNAWQKHGGKVRVRNDGQPRSPSSS